MVFEEVNTQPSFSALEQDIERWWREREIVRKALDRGDRSRPYVFFEGPPTANGRPGIHHVAARVTKDILIRYHRLRGQFVVGARGGWDTHGLPVEIEVERELGFSGKADIERYGIAAFNEACKASVWRYIHEWERLTERIAYWIDLEHAYATSHNDYIESLWWILQTLWRHELLFLDDKVTMHCPRCGTSLSDHEVAQGFRDDVEDPSVWVRFRHQPSGHALDHHLAGSAFVAWTTTPWTLPANVALAVQPEATYVLVEQTGRPQPERLVLADALVQRVLGEGAVEFVAAFPGHALAGVHYTPLFPVPAAQGDGGDRASTLAHRVVADDMASLAEGTGIVHIAPAYGDLEIGRAHGLPTLESIDLTGHMRPEFSRWGFGGMFFKDADPLIIRHLETEGLLFRSGTVRHSYPFCWRCETPLLHYAKPSWYIRTTARKDALRANNERIHWVPEHIKHGRFGNWLENNVDWAVSRERYWGTPLPIWICASCRHTEIIGSVQELADHAGRDLQQLDLHRPHVDQITWACPACGTGVAQRVPDVADCWFDSGAMPLAQWHYPFENHELFTLAGQADYIAEAIDQTRGWFYTLHALATLLFDRPAFKNVVCLGHILDLAGRKMSKSRGNAVDPWLLLEPYGADATRWYMAASAPPYNPRRFAPDHVGEVQRQFLLTLWNTYAFFVTYANLDGWRPVLGPAPAAAGELHALDRWVLARLNALMRDVTARLEDYDIYTPAREIASFVEELSNWYVRRSRRRFWKEGQSADKDAAYRTLYTCLATLARLLAPFTPYISEALYRNLVATHDAAAPESVHLAVWPQADDALIDEQLITDTRLLLEVVTMGRAARRRAGLRVRQPLSDGLVQVLRGGGAGLQAFEAELRDELNVKTVRFLGVGDEVVVYRFKPNLPALGRTYGRLIPAITRALEELQGDAAVASVEALNAGHTITVHVDEQMLHLGADEVLLQATAPQGYAVVEGEGLLVALNTTLTPELRREGEARDIVRAVQETRKAAGLAITDRIRVVLEPQAGLDVTAVLHAHGSYIRRETLADAVDVALVEAGDHRAMVELEGGSLEIGVRRP
jgi:isoleucyl-tRNA synthetase